MRSIGMLGKLAFALAAAGRATATIRTFGASALEASAAITDTWASAEPVVGTSVPSVPKHVPFGGGHLASDVEAKMEDEPGVFVEHGVTTVTVYTATCPTPMESSSSTVESSTSASSPPGWKHSTVATLVSSQSTTTTSSVVSSSSSVSSTSTPTPNAPGTPTVSVVPIVPPMNETATRPSVPTPTHHDSAASPGMAAAAVTNGYKALVAVFVGLVLILGMGLGA